MGFWSRLFRPLEAKSITLADIMGELLHGMRTKSGQQVSWEKALRVSTVFGCVRAIAEGVSQVPLKLFQESEDGKTRLPAKEHPLYRVLHRRPNPWQTSFEWRETSVIHAALCGNGYSFINRYRSQVAELIPIQPQHCKPDELASGGVAYKVYSDGEERTFPASAILHLRGPSWNGYCGLEAIKLAREAVGLALATEETHAQFHQNGAKPSGVLAVEGVLDQKQYDQLRAHISKSVGAANAGVPMIVDHAAKWLQQSMSGVDAQHLETRLHQVREICAFMRVMPLMVGYSDKAPTYASAEQLFLAHVVHTLSPWYERCEQLYDVMLLTEKEQSEGYYTKFIEEGLLRGAMKDTADYLCKFSQNGIMTRNEARAKLDLNPLDGLDEPLTPANLLSLDGAAEADPPAGAKVPAETGA